jgi:hypothetical protein
VAERRRGTRWQSDPELVHQSGHEGAAAFTFASPIHLSTYFKFPQHSPSRSLSPQLCGYQWLRTLTHHLWCAAQRAVSAERRHQATQEEGDQTDNGDSTRKTHRVLKCTDSPRPLSTHPLALPATLPAGVCAGLNVQRYARAHHGCMWMSVRLVGCVELVALVHGNTGSRSTSSRRHPHSLSHSHSGWTLTLANLGNLQRTSIGVGYELAVHRRGKLNTVALCRTPLPCCVRTLL